jgi:hypothetical protein
MMKGLTKGQFLRGVGNLDQMGKVSKCDERMLRVMLKLGRSAAHPRRYARAMRWKAERGTAAHTHFGKLARRVCEESHVPAPEHPIWALFDMRGPDRRGHTLWRVWPDIYAALRKHPELMVR